VAKFDKFCPIKYSETFVELDNTGVDSLPSFCSLLLRTYSRVSDFYVFVSNILNSEAFVELDTTGVESLPSVFSLLLFNTGLLPHFIRVKYD
jgi:hypothetical protein